MYHLERLSEAEIARIICEFFTSKGYECKRDIELSSRGFAREFDVACTKDKEVKFIEIKSVFTIRRRMVQDLIAITQIPSFVNEKIYLAVPSTTQFQRGSRKLIKYSGLGLIIVQDPTHVNIVKEAFIEFKILDKFLADSLSSILKTEITYPLERPSYFTFGQYWRSRLGTVTIPKPFPLRIPEELLDHVDKLRDISYAENLHNFKKQYEKVNLHKDEYEVIMHALEDLWSGKYGKPQSYKSFESFKKFEPILKQIPGYRDHLIHSFQVFLMGAIIIDAYYQDFKSAYENKLTNAKTDSLDLSWLMCSTFHDFCYPIQMYDQISHNIFKEFLDLDFSHIELQIEEILFKRDQLKYVDQIVSLYSHLNSKSRKSQWVFDSECKIDDMLRSLVLKELEEKNHAPLGALTLLRKIRMENFVQRDEENYLTGRFSTDICPAALAILLHDPKLLLQIPNRISFETIPLSFLLIYCDTAQEYGRLETEGNVRLKSFEFLSNTVETTLTFNDQEVYDNKVKELQKVFDKILSQKLCFKLKLRFKGKEYSQNTCEQ